MKRINQLAETQRSQFQVPAEGAIEQHELNGYKQVMMKQNNVLARNNKESPLRSYMKFDICDPQRRIQLVKQNRIEQVKRRGMNMSKICESILENDEIAI